MRHIITVALIAALVVAGFLWLESGLRSGSGPLPESVGLGKRRGPVEDEPVPVPSSPRMDINLPEGPTHVSTRSGSVSELAEERGVVGEAVLAIIRKTHGADPRTMDRTFAREDIWRILESWRLDPQRAHDDITFFIKVWDQVDDDGVRYALSYLFRRIKDDRLIEPLLDLVVVHPWQAVDSIASIGTPAAIERLTDVASVLDKPQVRSQLYTRVARSGWSGAADYLGRVIADQGLTGEERFVAVEALGRVPDDPEARLRAYEIAIGPALPVADLGERNRDHPIRDLRSAAVLAVMQSGSLELTRRLLDLADQRDADQNLVAMVDLHIGTYQGSDLTELLVDRMRRRSRVSLGEARYLNARASRSDVPTLRTLLERAESPEAREMLEAAILNASSRG